MSRTTKDKPEKFAHRMDHPAMRKGYGFEYWSRRPGSREPGRSTKTKTHRLERRAARNDAASSMVELD